MKSREMTTARRWAGAWTTPAWDQLGSLAGEGEGNLPLLVLPEERDAGAGGWLVKGLLTAIADTKSP